MYGEPSNTIASVSVAICLLGFFYSQYPSVVTTIGVILLVTWVIGRIMYWKWG